MHGSCIDGINEYDCKCDQGYQGVHCEVNTDECISTPCLNDGMYSCQTISAAAKIRVRLTLTEENLPMR